MSYSWEIVWNSCHILLYGKYIKTKGFLLWTQLDFLCLIKNVSKSAEMRLLLKGTAALRLIKQGKYERVLIDFQEIDKVELSSMVYLVF